MKKISVIIPIYNAEQYLDQTIQSVQNQTYPYFELILIDDESTDKSMMICKKYAQKDTRITLLCNKTKIHGPGPTRNIGLDKASGDYIFFMDADDWIEPDLFDVVISEAKNHNPDIIQFGFYNEINGKQEEHLPYLIDGKNIITKGDIKDYFPKYWDENRGTLWVHMYHRAVINENRFKSMMNGEDICFSLEALSNAKKILYISKALYHYRIINGSTSHRWINETTLYQIEIWKTSKLFLESFPKKYGQDIYEKVTYDRYIWILYCLCMRDCPLTLKEKKKQISYARGIMELDKYKEHSCKKYYKGINRVKYEMVKYHLEWMILLVGPIFLRLVRGE